MFIERWSPDLDATQIGAKAAGLGRAIELGLAVPAGFVVTRAALRHFLAAMDLEARVQALLTSEDDRGARTERFAQLKADVLATDLPDDLMTALAAPVAALLEQSPSGLAVRSSGALEDSATASFAGIYDSFLGVTSRTDFWEAMRRCWCAAWSPEATDYARRFGLEPRPDQMAVLVQEVIPADAAGVIFTADPVTGNPWRFVLNSTFGLARDVVGGHAASDEFVLDWCGNRILERLVVEKPTMLAATPQGVRAVALPEARRDEPSLADTGAQRIAQAALALDRAFGCRVDVEWALMGDDLYVVQVRPITALPEFFPRELTGEEAKQTWLQSDGVWYHAPPQDRRLVAPLFSDEWALERWQRYALHENPPLPTPWQGEERDFNGYRYSTFWVWRGFLGLEESEQGLIAQEPRFRAQWETGKETLRRESGEVGEALDRARSSSELIPILLRVKQRAFDFNALSFGPAQHLGWRCSQLLGHFLQQTGSAVTSDALLEGGASLWFERTRALQQLAREIDEDFVREALLHQPLDQVRVFLMEHHPDCRFLARYEKLCWEFCLTPPSLASRGQDPGIFNEAQILFAVRSVLVDVASDIEAAWARSRQRAAACADEVRRELSGDAVRLARFERLLDWARYWGPALEDRMLAVILFSRLNETVWRTGRALMEEGITESVDDVHLLTSADLRQIAGSRDAQSTRALSQKRRREFERNQRLTPPAFLGLKPAPAHTAVSAAPSTEEPKGGGGPVFSGRGMTPWSATGVARAVRSLNDAALLASLTPEMILVCDGSSLSYYADWVSLFLVVKGLVIVGEHSGMHHAIQVARECGVAFVHLPETELSTLQDGARIAIDGAAGTVTLLEGRE
ncbi:MAG: PEP/pyruvate-binding domain-containing protein [Candidatus Latescibacterota bacterium]|jgi:hypothetical protein